MNDLTEQDLAALDPAGYWQDKYDEVRCDMKAEIERLTAAKEAWKGSARAYRIDRDHYHDQNVEQIIQIASLQARVKELEDIVCVYVDPTGAPDDEHDLIMSCHEWWREEQALATTEEKNDE